MTRAHFFIEQQNDNAVTIVDIGHTVVSVTNDVEAVVLELHKNGLGKRKLFYYDSEGQLDEILHDGNGNFIDFAPRF